jgi:hypothetical protein
MQWSANRVEKSGNRSFWHGANWSDRTKQNDKEFAYVYCRFGSGRIGVGCWAKTSWARNARKVRDVPEEMKREVYREYGITSHGPGDYEIDHLISLELGGSNSIKNLWPESHRTSVRASQHFRSFWGAWRTIAGYEAIHMTRKGQACWSAKVGLLHRFILDLFAATS